MSDKPGTPLAAAHLRPDYRAKTEVIQQQENRIVNADDFEDPKDAQAYGQWLEEHLTTLREPFADDQIEKLPKPMWKGAWDGLKGSNCSTCGGYHVVANCIHLDYVGHANATNRLLDADLLWSWEPLAYTEAGTPLFSDGGLWIKLTVCGVTRIGYGDGKTVKEVIGDAIRNAAMRFGVALDLWSKIDLHAERNPGDGQTRTQGRRSDGATATGAARPGEQESGQAVHQAPAENQDALDSLASVCDEHGYARGAMGAMYVDWLTKNDDGTTRSLIQADSTHIIAFAAHLVDQATADPRESADGQQSLDDEDDGGAGTAEAHTGGTEPVPAGVGVGARTRADTAGGEAGVAGDAHDDAIEEPPMTAEGAF